MCKQCEINPVYEFTNKRKLCKMCFTKWFQKKFLYTIRKFKMISNWEVIGFENKKDFRDVVLYDLLKIYSERGIVKLIKGNNNSTKTAIASTSDSEADKIIHILINKDISKLKHGPVEKKARQIIIKPLYLFLDKEVLLYAKLNKFKFKNIQKKKNEINIFLDNLELKHPELKQSIISSYLELFD